jgi:hypothetical protein
MALIAKREEAKEFLLSYIKIALKSSSHFKAMDG